MDIVNRLNQSLATAAIHPQDVFTLGNNEQNKLLYAVSEATGDDYGDRLTTEKITTAIAELTEKLLAKTRTLYQEFAQST